VAELETSDFAVCKTHWTSALAAATTAYGKPDHLDDKTSANPPTANAGFDYKDGEINAVLIGCLIQFDWSPKPTKP
jgi:hypothetical protein